ncbi:unnamed protein product [Linum trigynum]|uniref:RING-CH-type domain-containing protein n=1 Tax=Linum trigynum TaxID=586398 RepID=A0AAV2DZT1_9ROSI
MSVMEMPHHLDLEQGTGLHHLRRGSSIAGSDDLSCFSDAEDGGSTYSQFYSTTAGSTYGDYGFACGSDGEGFVSDSRRVSCVSEQSVAVEIGSGAAAEGKVHYVDESKAEVDCRICHLGLESNSQESGIPIELGCSCKADLAAAHKHCAETWFKIKGNKTCEICNSVAKNVVGITEAESVVVDHSTELNANNSSVTAVAATSSAQHSDTSRNFWQGHRFLNFLLACMVFAFVISWLFHFNVPSS